MSARTARATLDALCYPSRKTVTPDKNPPEKNKLYYGDNYDVLQEHIKDESVDLIYLDPPFNSRQDYNVLFAEMDGSQSSSQIRAFEDTWEWNIHAERSYEHIVERGNPSASTHRANSITKFVSEIPARFMSRRMSLPTRCGKSARISSQNAIAQRRGIPPNAQHRQPGNGIGDNLDSLRLLEQRSDRYGQRRDPLSGETRVPGQIEVRSEL